MHERRRARAGPGLRVETGEEELVYPRAVRLGATPGIVSDVKSRRRCGIQNRCDAEVGREILDILLLKNKYNDGGIQDCSPPLCESPPSRAGNPIVKDIRFVHDRSTRLGPGGTPSHSKYGSCTPVRSVPCVRVEGFFSPSVAKPSEARCLPVQCA